MPASRDNALKIIFVGLGLLAAAWFLREVPSTSFNGYGLDDFLDDGWGLLIATLVILFGAYKYVTAKA